MSDRLHVCSLTILISQDSYKGEELRLLGEDKGHARCTIISY